MTPNEFAKAMTFLGLNYNKGFTPEYIKMLYPRFASYSYEQIKEAIHKCIDDEKYIKHSIRLRAVFAVCGAKN